MRLSARADRSVDSYTVSGWSDQVPRLYLDSLVRLDLGTAPPTWSNLSLGAQSASASSGTGNSSAGATMTPRADSTLTYVPGMGTNGRGILVSIGGGTNSQVRQDMYAAVLTLQLVSNRCVTAERFMMGLCARRSADTRALRPDWRAQL